MNQYLQELKCTIFHSGVDDLSAKTTKVLKWTGTALLTVGLLFVGLRFLLPIFAPFIPALALAAALEPIVLRLSRHHIPRAAASGLCVLLSVGLLIGLLWLLGSRTFEELKSLAEGLPEAIGTISKTVDSWQQLLISRLSPNDPAVSVYVQHLLDGLEGWLAQIPSKLSGRLLDFLPTAASATPGALLFAASMLIGSYFISASFPEVKAFVLLQVPERFRNRARELAGQLKQTFGRWLKSQLLLSLFCFLELAAAFWLLGMSYSLLPALIISVIDALPVLGVGTVLIPWALYELLAGQASLGLGLGITYLAVTVLRSCMQAKLLGDQLGLHPLVTLLAIYAGYKVWGVMGMIVFPILTITIKQLNDSELLHLWKRTDTKEETHGSSHIQYNSGHGHEHTGSNEYPSR